MARFASRASGRKRSIQGLQEGGRIRLDFLVGVVTGVHKA